MSKSTSVGWTLLVTTIVALGIAGAWWDGVQWCMSAIENVRTSSYETIALSPDGEPLIQRYGQVGTMNSYQAEQLLTLTGDPSDVHPQTAYGANYIEGGNRYVPDGPLPWWQRLAGVNDGGQPATYWYVIHDGHIPGRAYGVGYHSKTKAVVGYFARTGFSAKAPPREEWFQMSGELRGLTSANNISSEPRYFSLESYFLLLADGKLWKIDVARRQVKSLLDCPAAYTLGTTWQIPDKSQLPVAPAAATEAEPDGEPKMPENTDRVAIRQPDNLIVFDKRTGNQMSFPLPASTRDVGISTWVLPDGKLLLFSEFDVETKKPPQLIWLDSEGRIIKEQSPHLASHTGRELPIPEVWKENLRAPVPLNKAMLFAFVSYFEGKRAHSFWTGFGIVWKRAWLAALALIPVGVVAAWAAYRRQKRFALPHAGVWAAFAFWFGIPGWIAYRFHRAWPMLDDCPACRQPTPRDRETCLECGASLPAPPLKGIEVFA
jgi:hypothetical protein